MQCHNNHFAIDFPKVFVRALCLFIRCTTIKPKAAGEPYKTHRLVWCARAGWALKRSHFIRRGGQQPSAQHGRSKEKRSDCQLVTLGLVLNGSGFPREDNIQHLIEQGYRYLLVSRKRKRSFDEEQAVAVKTAQGQPVKVQRVVNPQTGEVELHYHSELREKV